MPICTIINLIRAYSGDMRSRVEDKKKGANKSWPPKREILQIKIFISFSSE